MEKLNMS